MMGFILQRSNKIRLQTLYIKNSDISTNLEFVLFYFYLTNLKI